jgi:hypothetical protein
LLYSATIGKMIQRRARGQRISIQYAGIPKKSEFTDEPLKPLVGKTEEKRFAIDEFAISIIAPQEAAERFQIWLKRTVKNNDDYREMLLPMFKPTKAGESKYFPLIGEELWTISVIQ